jgi:hypothetical protein
LVGPLVAADLGAVPGIGAAAGGAIGVLLGSVKIELSGAYGLAPSTEYLTLPSGPGGEFHLARGTLETCNAFVHLDWELGPCALFDVGRVEAKGIGVDRPSSRTTLWMAPGAGAFVSFRATRSVVMLLDVDALFPIGRDRFVLDNVPGDVFRASPVAVRASFAGEIRF